jgi:hypothetical protein
MTIDTTTSRTRRALLTGGIGGLASLAASARGRPHPVAAASGHFDSSDPGRPAATGQHNAGGDGVVGQTSGSNHAGIHGVNGGSGVGAYGSSLGGVGVAGDSSAIDAPAVAGISFGGNTGVFGLSGGTLPPTTPVKTGIHGSAADDSSARGVAGQSTAGVGVHATATTGYAPRTSGRIKIDKASGVATIAAGNRSVLVTPGLNITSRSLVLLTPQKDIGTRRLWYTVSASANTITIRVSSAVSSSLKVSWLLLG